VSTNDAPRLIAGGVAVDDRGELGFVNDFDFGGVRRFYTVRNHRAGFVRAWHAHRREAKYVTVVRGAAIVACVAIDDWDAPSRGASVARYVLSDRKPSVLYVPAGYANGAMTLSEDAVIMYFSTSTLAESAADDVRFDARHWDVWGVEER
jgi:dTDP-4-dehydrorhamnose 3,5-epimerase